ncbi:MAG: trypsin-like peptidase domain-containing protein [Pirellula sp.]|nr:trypsin-like peptidase domain-containing protein [Pirellula sp.]
MNRLCHSLLVIAFTFICAPSSVFASSVGDCVAMYFYKQGCPQCHAMQRPIEQLIEAGWAVRAIDTGREPELAMRWHVLRYPTLVLVRNSREVDRIIAPSTAQEIQQRLLAGSSPDSIRERGSTAIQSGMTVRGQSVPAIIPMATALVSSTAVKSDFSIPAPAPSTRYVDPSMATVRIRVDEPSHEAVGTGTIIDTFQGEALVLTCGHLFRDTQGRTPIIVETFVNGVPRQHQATLIDFRADTADIGLVSFRTDQEVGAVRLVDHLEKLREGDSVYSWGCDQGAIPSRRDSRITKLNRYQGEPNVEVLGAPVQGRSGGGLFNAKGELIGVCYAADTERHNEGLYNAPEVVYQQLNRLGLQRLYSSNSSTSNIAATNRTQSPEQPMQSMPAQSRVTVMVEQNGTTQQWQIDNPTPELISSLQQQSATNRR